MTFADRILSFQKKLKLEVKLPNGVGVLNPYHDKEAIQLCQKFYKKFYDDNDQRVLILGINPGRFGGGITGIPFTDPVKLRELGIENNLQKKQELSADFIYQMIEACGGVQMFYKKYYISAVSPLGFVRDEKNLNYYDVKGLPDLLENFIVKCLQEQLNWGISTENCFCLGEGENYKYLKRLNERFHFFNEVISLPHPRFIMQYRRKQIGDFIATYKEKLEM